MFDLEGTLVKGKGFTPLPGALEALRCCRPNLVVTNNTTHPPADVLRALEQAGLRLDREQLLTPTIVLPAFLRKQHISSVLVIGTAGAKSLLEHEGFQTVAASPADAVVVGLDTSLRYGTLRAATRALLEGASLVALHENRLFQDVDGAPSPSVGATVAFLQHASGARAHLVGKPSKAFFEVALKRLGVAAEACLVVGDDPFSEVEGAKVLGMSAIFVLTGKYPSADVLAKLPAARRPDLVIRTLYELPCVGEPHR